MRAFALAIAVAAGAAAGCHDDNDKKSTTPGGGTGTAAIARVNGATSPIVRVGTPVEVTGTGFGAAPFLTFTQGPAIAAVAALPGSSDTFAFAVLPLGGTGGSFVSGPLTLSVSGSPAVTVGVLGPSSFIFPSVGTWSDTTSLPTARRAHAAAGVRAASGTSGFLFSVGGNNIASNLTEVLVNSIAPGGALGVTWTATASLPAPRAFAAVATADASNAPVTTTAAFLYVVGGQENPAGAPDATSTVFVGVVDRTTGQVANFTAGPALPAPRLAASAAVVNGFLYVDGGIDGVGAATSLMFVAPIAGNGALGAFVTEPLGTIPLTFGGAAFTTLAAVPSGHALQMGETAGPVLAPFAAVSNAPASLTLVVAVRAGKPLGWQQGLAGVVARSRHTGVEAFGQLLVSGGLFQSGDNAENSRIDYTVDGQPFVLAWSNQAVGVSPNLDVFNTAAVASPVLSLNGNPNFVILGGDLRATPGTLSATVRRTSLP